MAASVYLVGCVCHVSWDLSPSSPLPILPTTSPDFLPRICVEFYAT